MIDAGAVALGEVGYERLTTADIARRAQVPIGTFYQFFPDKRSFIQALIEQAMDGWVSRLSLRLDSGEITDLWSLGEAAFNEYVAMMRSLPWLRRIGFGDVIDLGLMDGDNDRYVANHLAGLMSRIRPDVDDPVEPVLICVVLCDSLVKQAFRRSDTGDEAVLREGKRALLAYLMAYFNIEVGAAPTSP